MYCKNCGASMNDNQAICLKCGVKTGIGTRYCANCGKLLADEKATVCLNCGVAIRKNWLSGETLGGKDKTVIILLCLFLGGFGVHNVMIGEYNKGFLKILIAIVSIVCLFMQIPTLYYIGMLINSVISIIDLVKICTNKYIVDKNKWI